MSTPNKLRKVRTSDGYEFAEQEDGTWTDGDMTFESLEQILDSDSESVVTHGGSAQSHREGPSSP